MKENTLKKIAKHLKMRFPTSQISKDLNYSQGVISQYLNDKKEISEKFKKEFEKFYNIKFADFEEENSSVSEQNVVFETTYDQNIADNKKEIEKIKKEIALWEEKIKEKPHNKEEYEKYIANYERQIFLHNELININLEAKRDYLESQKESENE